MARLVADPEKRDRFRRMHSEIFYQVDSDLFPWVLIFWSETLIVKRLGTAVVTLPGRVASVF